MDNKSHNTLSEYYAETGGVSFLAFIWMSYFMRHSYAAFVYTGVVVSIAWLLIGYTVLISGNGLNAWISRNRYVYRQLFPLLWLAIPLASILIDGKEIVIVLIVGTYKYLESLIHINIIDRQYGVAKLKSRGNLDE